MKSGNYSSWLLQSPRRSPHGERGLKLRRFLQPVGRPESLPARGAWIEIHPACGSFQSRPCRSPHGERGLKSRCTGPSKMPAGRSPHGERGLKFEKYMPKSFGGNRRSPHGERGLKFSTISTASSAMGRSPHGERGLKFGSVAGSVGAGFRRSPHGERGLKCKISGSGKQYEAVAPRTGSVG